MDGCIENEEVDPGVLASLQTGRECAGEEQTRGGATGGEQGFAGRGGCEVPEVQGL